MADRNETGNDAVLIVNGTELPVTNFSYSRTHNTAESKYNDSKNPYTGSVSYYYEGSFEWDGSIPDAKTALSNPDGSPAMEGEIIARGVEDGMQFGRVSPQGSEWNAPADGKTDGSQDWKADTGGPL